MPPITKKRIPSLAVPLILSSSVLLAPQAFADPQATVDSYTITSGQSFTFTPMENDAADPGHWLFIEEVNPPSSTSTTSGDSTEISNGFEYNGVRTSGSEITYTPGTAGTATFFYGVRQVPNGENAGPGNKITSAEVTITVTDGGGIPQPPSSAPPIVYGQVDSAVAGGSSILIDATDNDAGDDLTITWVGNPFGGTADSGYYSTGTASIVGEGVGNKIRFIPDGKNLDGSNVDGQITFFYGVTDSEGRQAFGPTDVDISPSTGSTGPRAGDDTAPYDFAEQQGGAMWIAPFWNDTGTQLQITAVGTNQNNTTAIVDNGKQVSYTPRAGFSGSDTFTYTVTDQFGGTDEATITVDVSNDGGNGGVNQNPDAVEDIQRIGIVPGATQNERNVTSFILSNDTDPDGDSLSVQSVGAARFGSVREDGGQVFYTPPNFLTSGGFTYVVSDGNGGTDAAAVTFGIVDMDNPTANPNVTNENITVAPGGTFTLDVIANDTDPNGDSLTLDQVTGGSQGAFTKNGNTITYTANGGASGTDQLFYGVADGQGGNGSGTVNITIQ